MKPDTGGRTSAELLRRFLRDERGATAIEYGLLVGMLTILVLAGYRNVANAIYTLFDTLNTTYAGAAN